MTGEPYSVRPAGASSPARGADGAAGSPERLVPRRSSHHGPVAERSASRGPLSYHQAMERFRLRTVSELWLLNAHRPARQRWERREMDRLVDSLLAAINETAKPRDASLAEKTAQAAKDMLVRAFRRRRNGAGGATGEKSRTGAGYG